MGYTTEFVGEFRVEPPLSEHHRAYLEKFARHRRMKWDEAVVASLPDPVRERVGLPVGKDGAYFLGTDNPNATQQTGLIDYNEPPGSLSCEEMKSRGLDYGHREPGQQPGLWCQWAPNADGTAIVWDEGEKFYRYVEWLRYLVENFLAPWGYKISGEVGWQGEDGDDRGVIYAKDNQIEDVKSAITTPRPSWETCE